MEKSEAEKNFDLLANQSKAFAQKQDALINDVRIETAALSRGYMEICNEVMEGRARQAVALDKANHTVNELASRLKNLEAENAQLRNQVADMAAMKDALALAEGAPTPDPLPSTLKRKRRQGV